jgi:arylsulfatase A-like enzyme
MYPSPTRAICLSLTLTLLILTPQAFALRQFTPIPGPSQRIEEDNEYRDAWKLSAKKAHRFTLDEAQADWHIRVGVLPSSGSNVEIIVYAGKDEIARHTTDPAASGWYDWRVPTPADATGTVQVSIESSGDVWLHHCEYVSPERARPNVLVYLVDTLRLDKLSAYGYRRYTSPHITAFARDAVTFTQAMPQSSWTKPSVASLFTSSYPNVHGAQDALEGIDTELPTLASTLQSSGYATSAFVANPVCLPQWGFDKGFDRYKHYGEDGTVYDDRVVVDDAIKNIQQMSNRPWFLYVHTFAPHGPYAPPEPFNHYFASDTSDLTEFEAERRRTLDAYDGEVAFTDQLFGQMVAALKKEGVYDNTLIVFVSDHGEEFWEHGGTSHGHSLHEELLRVPLLIKLPESGVDALHAPPRGIVQHNVVQLMDLAPTALTVVGEDTPETFSGRSIVTLLHGKTMQQRYGYASLLEDDYSIRAAKDDRYKYIRDLAEGTENWYDLRTDPTEQSAIAGSFPQGQTLAQHIEAVAAAGAEGLNILVTTNYADVLRGADLKRTVTGTIRSTEIESAELQYHDWKSDLSQSAGEVRFEIQTLSQDDRQHAKELGWGSSDVQDHALLRVKIPRNEPFTLDLRINGAPIEPQLVRFGKDERAQVNGANPIEPKRVLANPDDYDPASLPQEFAVYVWYAAPGEQNVRGTLTREQQEGLEALGYL